MPKYNTITEKINANEGLPCKHCHSRPRWRASNYCFSCKERVKKFGHVDGQMIFRRQFSHFESRVNMLITQISDRDGFKNVEKWVEAFKNHQVIGRGHEFSGEIQAIKYASEFTTMNLSTRLGALLYYDELEAASALPIIRNNTQKHYLIGSHAIKLAGVPVKGRSTSYTTRLYQTLGQVIQRGIGLYLFNVAHLLRRIDMETERKQSSMKEFVEFELVIKPKSKGSAV